MIDGVIRFQPLVGQSGDQVFQRPYPGDAGLDLYCQETVVVQPGEFRDVSLGVAVQLPEGWWGLLTGRSSTIRNLGLMVTQGVIDNGYRGPLFAGVWNLRSEPVTVSRGMRIAQLIPVPIWQGSVVLAGRLDPHERGTSGFGSSGS